MIVPIINMNGSKKEDLDYIAVKTHYLLEKILESLIRIEDHLEDITDNEIRDE